MSFFLPSSGSNSGSTSAATRTSPTQPRSQVLPSPGHTEDPREISGHLHDTDAPPPYPHEPSNDGDNNRTDEGKGKAKGRQRLRSLSPPFIDSHSRGQSTVDAAKQAYLSPPLTNAASDALFFRMGNLSRALSRGLSFDWDMDLGSDGSRSSLSGSDYEEQQEDERKLEEGAAASDFFEHSVEAVHSPKSEFEGSFVGSSSISTSTSTARSYTTTRKATVGDTTLDDPGSTLPAVRFPNVFMNDDEDDLSTLSSTTSIGENIIPIPVLPPRILPVPSPVERRLDRQAHEDERPVSPIVDDKSVFSVKRGRTHHRRRNFVDMGVKDGKRRTLRRKRRAKSQERGLTRDFLLVITLCFGLACAGILVLRPTVMALLGIGTLGGRLDFE